MCTAGGLLVAAAGAVGLAMTAVTAPRSVGTFQSANDAGKARLQHPAGLQLTQQAPAGGGVATTDDYQWDDGVSENSLGLTAGGDMAWIHHFNRTVGAETLVAVSTSFGSPLFPGGSGAVAGDPFVVYVWSDPDGDGSPVDAVLLASAPGVVAAGSIETDVLQKTAIGPVALPASFFIGASFNHAAGSFPGPMDTTVPVGEAWVDFNNAVYDPNLVGGALDMAAIGFPANWLLRANAIPSGAVCGDGVCDPGEDPCNCPADCGPPPFVETGLCFNGIDDDCDGLTDCADPDCQVGTEAGLCTNGIDDDCDGLTDCDDADCATDPACVVPPGACCLQDGQGCVDTIDEAECDLLLGHFNPGQSCTDPNFICTGNLCNWDNGTPLNDFGSPGSQCDPNFPFQGAAADDFILSDSAPNPCQITNVTVWTSHFNQPAGVVVNPPLDYQGLVVTVYLDGGVDGQTKGPAGQPVDGAQNCGHEHLAPGGIVYHQVIPMAAVTVTDLSDPNDLCTFDDLWQLDIPVNMILKKKVKYWLTVQPIMDFATLGQVALVLSSTNHGHPAQQIFPAAGLPTWQEIAGNSDGCPPDTPPAGTFRDIAFRLDGLKINTPPNDDCLNKEVIVDGWVHFDTTGATTDGPPVTCALGQIENDIWFNYTAKCDGIATFSLCKDVLFDTVMAVYDGCNICPPGPELACDDDGCPGPPNVFASEIVLPVIAGNCYTIRVGGWTPSEFGNGTLSVECNAGIPPCPKDFTVLAPGSFSGNTCGAVDDIPLRPSEDHSYTVTIPNDGDWTFSLCNSAGAVFDTYIYLGSACGLGDIGSNDDFCGLRSEVTATLTAGDYWVTIEAFGATQCGDYTLDIFKGVAPGACCLPDGTCVDVPDPAACTALGGTFQGAFTTCATTVCPTPLPNDNCVDAIKVTNADSPIAFSTIGATTDGLPHAVCQFDGQTYNDIWYHYLSDFDGAVDIFTCNNVDYDSDLVVYLGCSNDVPPGPCPPTDAELIDCNDDGAGCAGFSSFLKINVVAGQCYTVRVGGWMDGDVGTGTLSIEKQPPPVPGACCLPDGSCVDVASEADCTALGGVFQGAGTDCATTVCPIPPKCMMQPPNQVNGIFSDLNCGICGTGIQVLAENFNIFQDDEIDFIRFWGGYFPANSPLAVDAFTVIFRVDDGAGLPGAIINVLGPIDATTRVATGVVLFGVDEYEYTIALDPNKALGPGSYWIEIYNDTTLDPAGDDWFWETGDGDIANGKPGQAFSFTIPEEPWSFDAVTDMAVQLVCKEHCTPQCIEDLNGDCIVGFDDLVILLTAWVAGTAQGDVGGPGGCGAANTDGVTDFFDLSCLLSAWAAGACN